MKWVRKRSNKKDRRKEHQRIRNSVMRRKTITIIKKKLNPNKMIPNHPLNLKQLKLTRIPILINPLPTNPNK